MNVREMKKQISANLRSYVFAMREYKKTYDAKRSFQHENQKGECTLKTVSWNK